MLPEQSWRARHEVHTSTRVMVTCRTSSGEDPARRLSAWRSLASHRPLSETTTTVACALSTGACWGLLDIEAAERLLFSLRYASWQRRLLARSEPHFGRGIGQTASSCHLQALPDRMDIERES